MSDLREFTVQPSEESGSSTSKIIAGAAVALMIGAAGAYVYATNSKPPPQKVALSEPAPLTPPPAAVATTPADTATPAHADVAPSADNSPAKTPPPSSPSSSMSRARHETHAKAQSIQPQTAPAVTPPDTARVPDIPASTTTTPQAAPAPPEQKPDTTSQTATPNDQTQTQTPDAAPQTP
jgi:hypothetical protein